MADSRWKAVWRWQGPNKIRNFLWLTSHNRLLTNEERSRRHLTTQVFCSFCSSHTESCVHILRDCTFARQFWSRVLPQVITSQELSKDWSIWFDEHIRCYNHYVIFGVGMWLLWRARNKRVFEQDKETTDGSLQFPQRNAAAGGVIRDDRGCLVKAFTMNLGCCSITRAEMRGIVEGLKLDWSLGIRRIRVQSDSAAAIAILSNGSSLDHQHAILVMQYQELCKRQWEVTLHHIYREANCAADYLANLGHSFMFGFHFINLPDRGRSHWLCYDIIGVSLPRSVSLLNNI
ncbi:Putative ribonuclease H protein At1g65750 [Linum grandiflorum]